MMDQNTCFAYLNMELPDDIRRLKEADRKSTRLNSSHSH